MREEAGRAPSVRSKAYGKRGGAQSEPSIHKSAIVPRGDQIESLWGKRRGSERTLYPQTSIVPRGDQIESLWEKGRGLERRASTQDSGLLYFLIREIKTWLNINHITVDSNIYRIF